MHMMGAIEEEDKLDADEAKKVLRRAGRMALPFKKTIAGALAFTALDARHRARPGDPAMGHRQWHRARRQDCLA